MASLGRASCIGTALTAAVELAACARDAWRPPTDDRNVVLVSWGGEASRPLSWCSGTYLGSGCVLTAAHCLPLAGGTAVSVTFVDGLGQPTVLRSTDHVSLPGASRVGDPTNDLAVIAVRGGGVPSDLAGIPLLDDASGPLGIADIGGTLAIVGFGAARPSTGPGARHRGTVALASLDDHTARTLARRDSAAPCDGDSGGPLLVSRGGAEYLAGVVSTGDCATETTYTRADAGRNAAFIRGKELREKTGAK